MSTHERIKFLSTFDGTGAPLAPAVPLAPAPQVYVVPQAAPVAQAPVLAPPAPAAQALAGQTIPVSAVPAVLDMLAQREAAAAAAVANARAAAQHVAPPTNVLAAPPVPVQGKVTNVQLQEQLTSLTAQLQHERMEGYRQKRINDLRSQGVGLIDGIVMGKTQADIETSLQIAAAEYQYVATQVQTQIQQQQQAAASVPAVQGYVGAVGGQPVAPAAPPHQQMHYQVGAPQMVATAGIPEQPQDAYMQQVAAATSTAGVRSGQYAMLRDQLMGSLRQSTGGPGDSRWSFQTTQQLTPVLQAPASAPAPVQPVYAAQQLPQPVHTAAGMAFQQQPQPTHAPAPPMGPPGIPAQAYVPQGNPYAATGQALQPNQLDAGMRLDPAAARVAAMAAIAQQRTRVA